MASLSPGGQQVVLESMALAERTRWAGYLLTAAMTLQFVFYPIFGLWYATVPWAALRRVRRKNADWAASRQASPYYLGGALWPILVVAVIWNLGFGLITAAQPFLTRKGEDPSSAFASYVAWQSLGLAALAWFVAAIVRRRHFRSWRLQVEVVPVLPGETVAFEISRTDSLPIGPGLRLELMGNMISRELEFLDNNGVEGDLPAADSRRRASACNGHWPGFLDQGHAADRRRRPLPYRAAECPRPGPPLRLPPRAEGMVDEVSVRGAAAGGVHRAARPAGYRPVRRRGASD